MSSDKDREFIERVAERGAEAMGKDDLRRIGEASAEDQAVAALHVGEAMAGTTLTPTTIRTVADKYRQVADALDRIANAREVAGAVPAPARPS
jgi:hypothetical protein